MLFLLRMPNKISTAFSQFSKHSAFDRFVKFDKFDRWNYGKRRLVLIQEGVG